MSAVLTMADFAALPEREQQAVRARAKQWRIQRSFNRALQARGVDLYPWQQQLAEVLESVTHDAMKGSGRNVILEAPPQVGKSWLVVSQWIPWWLRCYPRTRTIVIGADGDLIRRLSTDAQDAYDGWADLYGGAHRGRLWTMSEWTTEAGGRCFARGVTGNVTGGGYVGGVADDLLSLGDIGEAAKDKAWTSFRRQFLSRRNAGAATVLMAHRVAPDDVTGRWKHHMTEGSIPFETHTWRMVAEEDEGWRRKGDLLCPERVSREIVDEARRDPWFFETTYQQHESREAGEALEAAWLNHRYPGDPAAMRRTAEAGSVVMVCDCSSKTKKQNDMTAITIWSKHGRFKRLLHHEELRPHDVTQRLFDLGLAWRPDATVIEDTSIGPEIGRQLQARGVRGIIMQDVAGHGDKVARMRPYLADWLAGDVQLPNAEFTAAFVAHMLAVPRSGRFDTWDTVTLAFAWYASRTMHRAESFSIPGI